MNLSNNFQFINLISIIFILLFSQTYVFSSTIYGTVLDSLTGLPIADVNIVLINKNISTQSDSTGVFYFNNLETKNYVITFEHIAYISPKINIKLLNNQEVNLNVLLKEKILKTSNIYVEKNKWHSPFYDQLNTAQKIESAAMINSLGGFEDPFKSLQDVSGIQARHDFTSQFYIHGCGPEHHVVTLDGLTLYNPYRIKFLGFGGLSIFNPDVLNSLTIKKGGYEAAFGDRMGSHIALHTKEVTGVLNSSASINLLSSRATFEIPVTNRIATIISGRRTYYDWMIDMFSDENIIYPYFYDLYNKWSWQIADNHNFNLIQIFGKEGANITSTKYSDFNINFKNEAINSLTKLELSGSLGQSINYRLIAAYQENRDSSKSKNANSFDTYEIKNNQWTWKLDINYLNFSNNSITTGIQVKDIQQFGKINLYFLDNKIYIPEKTVYNKSYSWFVQNNMNITSGFSTNLGFRLDYCESKEEILESPRMSFKWIIYNNWTLINQMGIYYQYPKLIDNFYNENIINVSYSLSDLPAMKSKYISFVIKGDIYKDFSIQVNPYFRYVENIPVAREYFGSRYAQASPDGKVKSIGIDILLNHYYQKGFINIGYAFSKTELKNEEAIGYQPVFFDQRHWINANMEYELLKTWSVTSAIKYGSGFPLNTINALVESEGNRWYQIKSDKYIYSNYFRWDIRITYQIKHINFYLEIINITNSKNFDSQFYYDSPYDDTSTIRIFNVYMIPRLPVFGFSIKL